MVRFVESSYSKSQRDVCRFMERYALRIIFVSEFFDEIVLSKYIIDFVGVLCAIFGNREQLLDQL